MSIRTPWFRVLSQTLNGAPSVLKLQISVFLSSTSLPGPSSLYMSTVSFLWSKLGAFLAMCTA